MKPKARSTLRNFRTRLNIDAQDHLLAVEKQVSANDMPVLPYRNVT